MKNESKMKYKKCWEKNKPGVVSLFLCFELCVFGNWTVSRFSILHLLLPFEWLIDGRLVFCETGFVIFSSLSMSVLVKVSYDCDAHILNILCLKDKRIVTCLNTAHTHKHMPSKFVKLTLEIKNAQ